MSPRVLRFLILSRDILNHYESSRQRRRDGLLRKAVLPLRPLGLGLIIRSDRNLPMICYDS